MRLKQVFIAAICAANAAPPAAWATQPIPAGQRLAASCAACHGTNGKSAGTALPNLAGQSKQALAGSLRAFKAGSREATIMHQIARGYTDDQIESIAAYFAAQGK